MIHICLTGSIRKRVRHLAHSANASQRTAHHSKLRSIAHQRLGGLEEQDRAERVDAPVVFEDGERSGSHGVECVADAGVGDDDGEGGNAVILLERGDGGESGGGRRDVEGEEDELAL